MKKFVSEISHNFWFALLFLLVFAMFLDAKIDRYKVFYPDMQQQHTRIDVRLNNIEKGLGIRMDTMERDLIHYLIYLVNNQEVLSGI